MDTLNSVASCRSDGINWPGFSRPDASCCPSARCTPHDKSGPPSGLFSEVGIAVQYRLPATGCRCDFSFHEKPFQWGWHVKRRWSTSNKMTFIPYCVGLRHKPLMVAAVGRVFASERPNSLRAVATVDEQRVTNALASEAERQRRRESLLASRCVRPSTPPWRSAFRGCCSPPARSSGVTTKPGASVLQVTHSGRSAPQLTVSAPRCRPVDTVDATVVECRKGLLRRQVDDAPQPFACIAGASARIIASGASG